MKPDQLLPFALIALVLVAFGALALAYRALRTIERMQPVVPRLSPRTGPPATAPFIPGRAPSGDDRTVPMRRHRDVP